jgi:transposase
VNRILAQADATSRSARPPATFACGKCHRLRRQSRCDPNAWNELVTSLSAGLLYGHEVERPSWFPKPTRIDRVNHRHEGTQARRHEVSEERDEAKVNQSRSGGAASSPSCLRASVPPCLHRTIPYIPRPNRAPSQRRPQIEKLLLAGKTFKEIAVQLGLVYGTVLWFAQQIYKQHGVRTLPDLLRKHGQNIPPPPTKEVARRLLAGESIAQIEAALHCGKTMIYNQRQQLRKRGHKLPDTRAARRSMRTGAGC